MSTSYGHIPMPNGRYMTVEAYGATGVVKLEFDFDCSTVIPLICLTSPKAVDQLIAALEMARDHCWTVRT